MGMPYASTRGARAQARQGQFYLSIRIREGRRQRYLESIGVVLRIEQGGPSEADPTLPFVLQPSSISIIQESSRQSDRSASTDGLAPDG
jgi:hypothetical protein